MISTQYKNNNIFYWEFLYFGLDNFKVVCCTLVVCGKGLKHFLGTCLAQITLCVCLTICPLQNQTVAFLKSDNSHL